MQLIEIIRNLRKIIKDTSDDRLISDYQMIFIINYIRSFLIRQDYEKGRSLSSNVIQDLGVVNFVSIDKAESSVTNATVNIFRSEAEIPKPIEVYNKDLITYIGGVDKQSPIQFTTKARATWDKHGAKFTHGKERSFIKDGYMYIEGCEDYVVYKSIEGVFENPIDVWVFKGLTTHDDPDLTLMYPMSSHMIRTMNDLILQGELNILNMITDDKLNNATKDGLLRSE